MAEVAEAHVKYCIFAHDECRATSKYYYVGQNIAIRYYSHEENDVNSLIQLMISQWWDEWKLVSPNDAQSLIENYRHT